MIPTLDLRGLDGRRRGEVQGEAWREAALALVEGRLDRLGRNSRWSRVDELEQAAERVRALVVQLAPDLADELDGVARALARPRWRVYAANAHADLWDWAGPSTRPESAGPKHSERSTLYVVGDAPLLGQALLAGPEREALGIMLLDGGAANDGPPVRVVALAGTLGLGGARSGLVVAFNHLRSRHAAPGTFLGVELRGALLSNGAAAAQSTWADDGRRRGGGRFFLCSDGDELFGVESDGPRAVVTRRGPRTAHMHTDHFFDPGLRRAEIRDRGSSTYRRTELLTSVYVQRRPHTPRMVWSFLRELDGLRGASGDEHEDRSALNLYGASALWVARATDGAVWVRTGLADATFPEQPHA